MVIPTGQVARIASVAAPLFAVAWTSILIGSASLGCSVLLRTDTPDGGAGAGGAGGAGGAAGGTRGPGGSTGGPLASGTAGIRDAGGTAGTSDAGSSAADAGVADGPAADAGSDASSCATGAPCTPSNPCHFGRRACAPDGTVMCVESPIAQANGTVCGQNMVCGGGACVACQAGSACTQSSPCRTASNVCTTGVPICTEDGNRPNGTACATGKVCPEGQCATRQAGAACMPGKPRQPGAV